MFLLFNYLITKSFSTGGFIFLLCLSINNLQATPDYNYSMQKYEQTIQCEYYKYNANGACKTHSSLYEERQQCTKINKQRWCECMGKDKDCYKQRNFYW